MSIHFLNGGHMIDIPSFYKGTRDVAKNLIETIPLATEEGGVSLSKRELLKKEFNVLTYAHDLKGQLLFASDLKELAEALAKNTSVEIHQASEKLHLLSVRTTKIYEGLKVLQTNFEASYQAHEKEIGTIKKEILEISTIFESIREEIQTKIDEDCVKSLENIAAGVSLAKATVDQEFRFPSNLKKILERATEVVNGTKKILQTDLNKELEEVGLRFLSGSIRESEKLLILSKINKLKKRISDIPHKELSMDIDKLLDAVFESPTSELNFPSYLSRIISNILTNATKYGGDKIVLEAKWMTSDENPLLGELLLTIKDNGSGIVQDVEENPTTEQRERVLAEARRILFSSGIQASTENHHLGSGLGGASLKELVTLLDGKIDVLTKGGGIEIGTTITVRLPLMKPKISQKIPAPLSKNSFGYLPSEPSTTIGSVIDKIKDTQMHIIVIDDNVINRLRFQKMLNMGLMTNLLKLPSPKISRTRSDSWKSASPKLHAFKELSIAPISETETSILQVKECTSAKSAPIKMNPPKMKRSSILDMNSPLVHIMGETEEGLFENLKKCVDQAVQGNYPLAFIVDRNLTNQKMQGDDLVRAIREYIQSKHSSYKRVYYISYTADLPEDTRLYDGFLEKTLGQEELFGALHSAIKYTTDFLPLNNIPVKSTEV